MGNHGYGSVDRGVNNFCFTGFVHRPSELSNSPRYSGANSIRCYSLQPNVSMKQRFIFEVKLSMMELKNMRSERLSIFDDLAKIVIL